MKFMMGLLAAVVLLASMGASHAVVRIGEDRGGRIGTYVDKYQNSGDNKVLPLLPGSYMALGKAFMGKAAQNEERKMVPQANQNYAEARWQFIHVVAQFFDKDEYVANAHFLAGVCYDKLKDMEPDASDKAVRHWRLVVSNFPNSSFKALAEQQLTAAGASSAPAPAPEAPKKEEPKKKG